VSPSYCGDFTHDVFPRQDGPLLDADVQIVSRQINAFPELLGQSRLAVFLEASHSKRQERGDEIGRRGALRDGSNEAGDNFPGPIHHDISPRSTQGLTSSAAEGCRREGFLCGAFLKRGGLP